MNTTTTTVKGRRGEDVAVLVLEREGYVVVARNVRVGRDEIDVVANDGDVLCFVEVRKRDRFDDALRSVDAKKQSRISRAATKYLATIPRPWPVCRFDVVIVAKDRADIVRNAFASTR
jgi:putative endonuclease